MSASIHITKAVLPLCLMSSIANGLLFSAEPVTVSSGGDVTVGTTLTLNSGATVNEVSTDGTLAGDSDSAVPTEKAVKAYVDSAVGAGEFVYFRAYRNVAKSVATGTDVVLNCEEEIEDSHSKHSGGVFTVPGDSIYHVSVHTTVQDLDTGRYFELYIVHNGTKMARCRQYVGTDNDDPAISVSTSIKCATGDTIQVIMRHNDSGSRSLFVGSEKNTCMTISSITRVPIP